MKKKLVFIGDTNSINIEIILKSHQYLKNKLKYVVIGNSKEIFDFIKKNKFEIKVNEILDPFDFSDYFRNSLNVFNIQDVSKYKYKNLLNQIYISNVIANKTKFDLVTLAIDKSIFKKKIKFIGMTEYLGELNKKKTIMLMHGNKFSIVPLTTHINLKEVNKYIKKSILKSIMKEILVQIKRNIYDLNYSKVKFLCFNPHCGENGTIGKEDLMIKESLLYHKKISGPYAADSAFINIQKNILFLSMYHDQALIPFKILNDKCFNLTLGLDYRRLSPAHGTAKDIKNKNLANNTSYIECMKF